MEHLATGLSVSPKAVANAQYHDSLADEGLTWPRNQDLRSTSSVRLYFRASVRFTSAFFRLIWLSLDPPRGCREDRLGNHLADYVDGNPTAGRESYSSAEGESNRPG
jgi:hypothetical protein